MTYVIGIQAVERQIKSLLKQKINLVIEKLYQLLANFYTSNELNSSCFNRMVLMLLQASKRFFKFWKFLNNSIIIQIEQLGLTWLTNK